MRKRACLTALAAVWLDASGAFALEKAARPDTEETRTADGPAARPVRSSITIGATCGHGRGAAISMTNESACT